MMPLPLLSAINDNTQRFRITFAFSDEFHDIGLRRGFSVRNKGVRLANLSLRSDKLRYNIILLLIYQKNYLMN